ncbi:hypothetical protein DAPPUDRAFT_330780 [Daphnia pulex]|uniref:CCHC-type domain-containing protein n=1 Tax=Daphnia pulex TaxID=6669 RepID=E9HKM7_DAPPU|nr:hypothetical protein DAPPUDRAFT_330780 [Daphnia pulex]|eukprot:EFX67683.1 hypothetical protein DAPPUDRAFT_330780 [Daphnia pulex]
MSNFLEYAASISAASGPSVGDERLATGQAVVKFCYNCHKPGHIIRNCPGIRNPEIRLDAVLTVVFALAQHRVPVLVSSHVVTHVLAPDTVLAVVLAPGQEARAVVVERGLEVKGAAALNLAGIQSPGASPA